MGHPSWLDRLLRWVNDRAEAYSGLDGLLAPQSWFVDWAHFGWADVIDLRNLHGHYFCLWMLPRLERAAPLVWRLPDMWALTGHCAHPLDCTGWLSACGQCAHLSRYPPVKWDATGLVFAMKKRILARITPFIVTPSRWLGRQVLRSPLTARFRRRCIPNGIDTSVFSPVDRASARRSLGLLPRDRAVLFVAQTLSSPLKGGDLLLEALGQLKRSGLGNVRLITVGRAGSRLPSAWPYPVLDLGQVDDDRTLSRAYSAADVFAGPSRAEAFGLVFVESMACGLPVVAFDATAVPEVVRDGRTGLLARPFDPLDFARCLRRLLTDDSLRRRMSLECRDTAQKEYDYRLMTRRYIRLYDELIEQRAGEPRFDRDERRSCRSVSMETMTAPQKRNPRATSLEVRQK